MLVYVRDHCEILKCFGLIDFPQERCPVVLAPLLYPEKRDILMDRILPDSGGIAKTMMESSLADFMQEVGYGFCTRYVQTVEYPCCAVS